MNDYERDRLILFAKMVLWLNRRADDHELTHGEKHYFHRVMEDTLIRLIGEIKGCSNVAARQYADIEANDIPF